MLNLLPPKQRKELRLNLLNQAIAFSGIAIILVILVLALLLLLSWTFLRVNLEEVNKDLFFQQTKAETKEIDGLEKKVKTLNASLIFLDKIQKEQSKSSLFLENLAKDVSSGIQIKNFSMDKSGKINLRGYALTRDVLLTFKNILEEASYVSNFEFPLSNLTKAEDIDFYLSFELVD